MEERLKELRIIWSNIYVQIDKLTPQSDDLEGRAHIHQVEAILKERGIEPRVPNYYNHVKAIEKMPQFDAFVLKRASRAHRRKLLEKAHQRVDAMIKEIEQEQILDLIIKAKYETGDLHFKNR